MRNVNTVIFDLGRVLVRIHTAGDKFGALMNAIGVPPDEAFARFWFATEVRQHMTGELGSQGFYQAVRDRFRLSLGFEEFAEAWCNLFEPMPGMEEIFLAAADRYQVGILSDTDPLHWEHIRKLLPWLDKVAKPTLSYEVGYLKPHPKMFAAAAANAGRDKEECLFIDDQIANVDGARYSGMPGLLFSTPEKLRKDLNGLRVL